MISDFLINCIRTAFTRDLKLGPQEYLASTEFEVDYLGHRKASLGDDRNLTKIAFEETSGDTAGYIEFGPPKAYLDGLGCRYELLCFFTSPSMLGKGVGSNLLWTILRDAIALRDFRLGVDSIGIQTIKGNPSVSTFYRKIGACVIKETSFSYGASVIETVVLKWDADSVKTFFQKQSPGKEDRDPSPRLP
ncbi:hypothetical protein FA10DRAFT_269857 [Acaromyces ingoldii]|uniref:N-acetyltransferase domain-containing protein n=1 Tax=Acaromyces ingoldii TaxID=215250 RepID=A0A316YA67_9BASI|nr:hypothetical protein FA10DRAFT_269857 [Acaromyces ingoldii]PWN86750.1 hypothetical protein FA10DRAFT_269857 [Acaromyces ingoldii]